MGKTQKQINDRIKAYKKGTVDSPYRITKVTTREPGFVAMQPGAIDVDKRYNAQCMDLIIDYVLWYTDNKVRTWGNARDAVDNKLEPYFTWHDNTPNYVPPVGSIGVATFGTPGYEKYGHIWIVYGKANVNTVQVLEQNWNGYANLAPQLRTDNYYGCAGFWVPNLESNSSSNSSSSSKPSNSKPGKDKPSKDKPNKKKPIKLKYNRDEVKGYKLPKRGYKPKGVVIHNDAGGSTAMQYHDSLVNAPLSRLEQGIAHSYISGDTVWQALPESRIAWATADEYGNQNYYSIEGCKSLTASDEEFLQIEQAVFQETARMLKKWKLPVNRDTILLHNELSPTQCPHRSMKLHAGYESTQRAPQAVVNKTKDYFISQVKEYYNGKIPTGSTIVSDGGSSKPATNTDWEQNKYGTWYKSEDAKFKVGSEQIAVHKIGPFVNMAITGWLQPGTTISYDEVMLQDGHVWVGYDSFNGRRYLPIRTWNGITPPNQGIGYLWGKIK